MVLVKASTTIPLLFFASSLWLLANCDLKPHREPISINKIIKKLNELEIFEELGGARKLHNLEGRS